MIWEDGWHFVFPDEEASEQKNVADTKLDLLIKEISRFPKGSYTFNCFIMPMHTPVMDDKAKRPYFPICILWLDHKSKMILSSTLCHFNEITHTIASSLLKEIKVNDAAPSEIIVPDKKTSEAVLKAFSGKIKIPVTVSLREQKELEDIKQDMGQFFG